MVVMCFILRVRWGSWGSLALQGAKVIQGLVVRQVIKEVKDYREQRYEGRNTSYTLSPNNHPIYPRTNSRVAQLEILLSV
jgi:hypothetical protein